MWLPYTPNIALFLDVILRQLFKHMMSYDSSNLEIWKGPFSQIWSHILLRVTVLLE